MTTMILAPIIHVALRFRGQIWSLPRPYRHHHIIRMIIYLDPEVTFVDTYNEDQGFLDETGRYLTREQALVRARLNGQVKDENKVYNDELCSENVW